MFACPSVLDVLIWTANVAAKANKQNSQSTMVRTRCQRKEEERKLIMSHFNNNNEESPPRHHHHQPALGVASPMAAVVLSHAKLSNEVLKASNDLVRDCMALKERERNKDRLTDFLKAGATQVQQLLRFAQCHCNISQCLMRASCFLFFFVCSPEEALKMYDHIELSYKTH